jgi:hypothetical protein
MKKRKEDAMYSQIAKNGNLPLKLTSGRQLEPAGRSLAKCFALLLSAAIIFSALTIPSAAQTVTGVILGAVVDPTDMSVPAASVILINEATQEKRSTVTASDGNFVFPALLPAVYTVEVHAQGFETYRKVGNTLTASSRLSLGTIHLVVGSVAQTVSVTGAGLAVQTASSEGSDLVSSRQLDTISQRGREIVQLLNLLPGVQTSTGQESIGGTYSGIPTTGANGLPSTAMTVTIDGQDAMDTGSAGVYVSYESFDAIDQVQVLLNNYQAEYGRGGGGMINVVTKAGTNHFHGTIYSYLRNEDLNATDFFNNKQHLPKTEYRYLTEGGAFGGPVTIPGLFNTSRKHNLFFFYNIEGDPAMIFQGAIQLTLPTALERQGNFSQTSIVVKDPNTNAPFPGNIIPSSRVNPNTQALLNLFPAPNQLNPAITNGAYNWANNELAESGKLSNVFRVDYAPNEKNMLYFRGSVWNQSLTGYNGTGGMTNWPLFRNQLVFPVRSSTFDYTHVFSPTVVNEFEGTARRNYLIVPSPTSAQLKTIQRNQVGYNIGQLYPQINPLNLIPQATFSGISDSPSFTTFYGGRYPAHRTDTVFGLSDGLTVTRGSHTLKAGVWYDKVQEIGVPGGTWVGSFDYGVNANNPGNTNDPYANALLGNFNSYTEPNARVRPSGVAYEADWYVQDSWKISRRLTLELGLRSEYDTIYTSNNAGQLSEFTMATYNAAQAPLLYQPTLVNGQRMALNPVTGQTGTQALIGAYVPGTGNVQNGLITATNPNFPKSFVNSFGELLQPRFGFAWDVFGNGKTAIRGGLAKFNELLRIEVSDNNPPIVYNTTIEMGNLGSFLGAGGGVFFPVAVTGWQQNARAPNVYNLTLGVQQDIGFHTVAEVQYVGTLGRNLLAAENLETLPYGQRFLPSSLDSTTGKPLPDTFLVPLPGYTTITEEVTPATSNYNALQAKVNRRFTQNLEYGVSLSFSKMMDYGSTWPRYANPVTWAYSLSTQDQKFILVPNYTYSLPAFSRVWPNAFTRGLLDHWSLSGLMTFASGLPSAVTFTTTNGADLIGGGDAQRINETCNPYLSHGQRNALEMFNPACFAVPALGSPGNAPRTDVRGPGFNQWDMTLFKEFALKSEKRTLQFRWEAYNVFNHTQFSAMNTAAQFNPAGAQTNGQFGVPTADRNPRTMQLSLRLRF